jgi:nucleoid-associated protein YgaU
VTALCSGCVSIHPRIVDRPRVDQELPAGAEEQYPNREKTRQVIEIEVDQKGKQEVEKKTSAKQVAPAEKSTEGQSKVVTEPKETTVVHDENFTFPKMTSQTLTQPAVAANGTAEQYVVQKDDTLQKISKKLYGSYSKWTVIYDENRDVIKDPNFLKPGKVLKIPVITVTTPAPAETSVPTTENK